jgi:hypothetical protein
MKTKYIFIAVLWNYGMNKQETVKLVSIKRKTFGDAKEYMKTHYPAPWIYELHSTTPV